MLAKLQAMCEDVFKSEEEGSKAKPSPHKSHSVQVKRN